eukprot:TRINITY_DN3479_c0_g1_i1.p1 TRINITY_DN3479_c0_g1~~TRINITY_DN3479_c0_g1_i1.p1  ORF type:complete len:128 (-),score=25.97 TRINITY_DN3479_c0_g1_i1:49-411(-)
MFRFSRVTKNDALSKASVQEAAAIYQKTKDGNSNMDFLNSLIGSNGKVDVSAAAKVAASLKSGATGKGMLCHDGLVTFCAEASNLALARVFFHQNTGYLPPSISCQYHTQSPVQSIACVV